MNSTGLKSYLSYVSTNKIMNILFSVLISFILSSILAFFFECNMYEVSVVIIILSILSFTFQNSEHDYLFFLCFLVLLFVFLIYYRIDLEDYVKNDGFNVTFIAIIIDTIIISFSKIKYENKIPFNIIIYDYLNAKFDGIVLKRKLKKMFKKDYLNENTHYIEKMDINKTNILNSIKEDYLNRVKYLNQDLKVANNKKIYFIEHSKILKERIANINTTLKKDLSATEKYHLLQEKDRLLNEKINFDNNLHVIEDEIYALECEKRNIDSVYELNIMHIENDYKVRYKNYVNVLNRKMKKLNRKVSFKTLKDIKNYIMGDKNDKLESVYSISE